MVGIVVAVACLAAAVVVGAVLLQTRGEHGGVLGVGKPRSGTPPLLLDLGVQTGAQAQALRHAEALYNQGSIAGARRIFDRYHSLDAQLGSAFTRWPQSGLDAIKQLYASHPRSAQAKLHLAIAYLWAGRNADAATTFQAVQKEYPDTQSAVDAGDFLFSGPPGVPPFVPGFSPPTSISRLPAAQRLAALAEAARRPDAHAKLLYGAALQSLGHTISAERQFAAAAKLAPNDAGAQVAAILGTFDKAHPQQLFPRLGPLVKRFPHAATVRFHLGLALIWINAYAQARKELGQARAEAPGTVFARQAALLLQRLKAPGTK